MEVERGEQVDGPKFDWMLNGGSFKAQPIEFWLFCLKNSQQMSLSKNFSLCYILC